MRQEKRSFEEIIKRDGQLLYLTVGRSMEPMLHERRNPVVITKIFRKLKKYDVVLYKRRADYVLHRIVKIKDGKYIIRGDNCYENEYNITDREIIGVLAGYYKGKKYIDCKKNIRYKLYCRIRCINFIFRKPVMWLKLKVKKNVIRK